MLMHYIVKLSQHLETATRSCFEQLTLCVLKEVQSMSPSYDAELLNLQEPCKARFSQRGCTVLNGMKRPSEFDLLVVTVRSRNTCKDCFVIGVEGLINCWMLCFDADDKP